MEDNGEEDPATVDLRASTNNNDKPPVEPKPVDHGGAVGPSDVPIKPCPPAEKKDAPKQDQDAGCACTVM